MVFEFKLPDIGEGVHEGEIVQWFVNEGDVVEEDQKIFEAMTDKATVEITSPKAGKVAKILVAAGEVAKVGDVVIVIDDGKPGETGPAQPAAEPDAPEAVQEEKTLFDLPSDLGGRRKRPAGAAMPRPAAAPAAEAVMHPLGKPLAAPAVRQRARETGIDLAQVPGSAPGGRITAADLEQFLAGGTARPTAAAPVAAPPVAQAAPAPAPAPAVATVAEDEVVPVRGLRKAIWDNMRRSEDYAVPFTYWDEFDVTELVKLRKDAQSLAEAQGVKLSYLPFIVKAVVAGLKQHPDVNAWVDESQQALIRKGVYNVGIATATERGLMVVVVKDVDKKSIFEIGRDIAELSEKARTGKAKPDELKGSTFTITSLGKEGGLAATPVINHPEVAILGVHKIEPRAKVDENRQVVVRDCMNLAATFDHRLIDGHVGAAFLQVVGRLLSQPNLLLLGTV